VKKIFFDGKSWVDRSEGAKMKFFKKLENRWGMVF
jgi:hypothetical protein